MGSTPYTLFGFVLGLIIGSLYYAFRQKNEENIKSENFMKLVLDSMSEGLVVVDRDYRILMANKSYSDLAKIPLDKLDDKHCYEVSHHIDKPCFEAGEDCAVKRAFDTGEIQKTVHTHLDKTGNKYLVDTKAYPIKDEKGRVTSALEVVKDITEQKRMEEMFLQSQKMEAVGRLAGGLAHDFNNILTCILGYSELALLKIDKDDPYRENFEVIDDAGKKATALVRQLLAFSRKQRLEMKSVNVNDLIDGLIKMLGRMIGENVILEFDPQQSVKDIMADPGQIEQIIMNLVVNARDSMPDGGRIIINTSNIELDENYTRIYADVAPGFYIMIAFTDTGEGMSEDVQEHIFDPFFTTKQEGKGTGLGLATVYGIVKQHGGHINVYSEVGKGTTFKIYFPVSDERSPEHKEEKSDNAFREGTETILVVDDDPTIRQLIVDTLQPLGYRLIGAANGEEALQGAEQTGGEIELLLTDVIMPGMNGRELANQFKSNYPKAKTILMSGYMDAKIINDSESGHEIPLLQKPLIPSELIKKLKDVLG